MLYCLSSSSSFQPLFLITTRFVIKRALFYPCIALLLKLMRQKLKNNKSLHASPICLNEIGVEAVRVPYRGGSNIQRHQNAKDGEMIHRPQWRRWHQRWLQCWLHGKTHSPLLVPPSPRSWPQSKIPLQFMNARLKDLVNTNMTTTKCVTGRKWIQTNKSLPWKEK